MEPKIRKKRQAKEKRREKGEIYSQKHIRIQTEIMLKSVQNTSEHLQNPQPSKY